MAKDTSEATQYLSLLEPYNAFRNARLLEPMRMPGTVNSTLLLASPVDPIMVIGSL